MQLSEQVGLLLWKNWLLQKRRICVSIFEILLPIAFSVLILLIRMVVTPVEYPDPKYYQMNSVYKHAEFLIHPEIGYTPGIAETETVMNFVKEVLDDRHVYGNVTMRPFDTESEALEYYSMNLSNMRHVIVFDDLTNKSSTLPPNVKFTIRAWTDDQRWRTGFTYSILQSRVPRKDEHLYKERVVYMQTLVSEALAKYWVSKAGQSPAMVNFGVYTQRMAYPPYFDDPLIIIIQGQLPLFLVLSFILSVIINTKNLVYEKEKKLKESMKLMGLTATAHWLSWFITLAIYLIPAMAVYSLLYGLHIMEEGPVLSNTDGSLFFIFLVCYALAMITFCFMVSTFVQKANVAAALAGILFFAFWFPATFIQQNYETSSKNEKLAGSLLFNTAMALGAYCIGILEGTGDGAQWSNFHKPGAVDDNLSLLECMIMLLVDTLIHLLITWYLDNVRPGEFGVPKPYYFCFTKSYWCGGNKVTDNTIYESETEPNRHFEKEPTGLEAGIKIINLRKTFHQRVAVAGTTLNMYKGQISVLLGHNGAGKTSTMSMLTGFIPPTSGTAQVNGYDIRTDLTRVRRSLGLCPQHNILFDALTVEEHLTFFAKLKGCTGKETKAAVVSMAKEVGLEAKFKTRSQHLSGGQKRKLAVGIALIGGSEVVILDEPTSGMDPAARRQTWNVLQKASENRTIVLSTHFMDEADVLGDRIAIMAEGVVKCCGSSMFLKKLYGAGYHLIIEKNSQCNITTLTQFIQSYVVFAQLESVINTEVSFLLPDSASASFPQLFRALDEFQEKLGINSFGTTATTMEEVFLKVGESAYEDDDASSFETTNRVKTAADAFTNPSFEGDQGKRIGITNGGNQTVFGTTNRVDVEKENMDNEVKARNVPDVMAFNKGYTKNKGLTLQFTRMKALFIKKAIHTWRHRTVTLVQLLLPVIFTIIGLAIDEARPNIVTEPPLTFNLQPFGQTYIPYGSNETKSSKLADLYKSQFESSQTLESIDMAAETFDNYTLRRAASMGISTFNKKMVIGMVAIDPVGNESTAAISYYNGQPFHSEPVSLNYVLNGMLQLATNDSFSVETAINPLPKETKEAAQESITTSLAAGFSIGFFICFGMAFLTTLFIHFLIKERQIGAKHMQVVSGVGPFTYWLPTFLWDFINYIIPSLLLLVVFAAYQKSAYIEDDRWALVILVLVVYGWAVLPFMYTFQFAFSSPPTGVVTVIMLNIVTGLVTTLAVFVLRIPQLQTEKIGDSLNWAFMVLFPNYNMATCFINMYANYKGHQFCEPMLKFCATQKGIPCCKATCNQVCIYFEEDYMSWEKPGIGGNLCFMGIQGAVFFIIVVLIEYHVFQRIWYLIRGASNAGREYLQGHEDAGQTEDSDVAAERQRINSTPASVLSSSDSLLLVNLFKRYGSFVSVDHICVGVPEQECFGLLGQNGAGKTTTFRMLTGNVMVTGGNAYLKGFDVRSNIKKVQANMGYCPQFDALIDQMTGRETLIMYARLRGVPEKSIKDVVDILLDILMLQPHADKLAGYYSGGNKRKLSTAMALVGDPPFIMLDEPSTGMDPKARRQLWNVLSAVRASGRTLVLTSHSMEECDALCTRIAIMVNGRFMCLGSPQHLKSKFGQGYTLIAQLGALEDGTQAPNKPVIDFITQSFPGAKVFDDHQGYIHFQVPNSDIKLADVFSLMETTKETLHVEDYSVHQTTLEQVFLTFTRGQIPPKDEAPKGLVKKVCCCLCLNCGCMK